MTISADLVDYPLSEILFYLDSHESSGWLTVENSGHEVTFTLYQGEIVATESNSREQRLGQRLVAAGTLTEDQLAQALDHLSMNPRMATLGASLVALGMLTPDEIKRALQAQTIDQVFEILIHNQSKGSFTYNQGRTSARGINADLNIHQLVFDAIRKADEWVEEQLYAGLISVSARPSRPLVELVDNRAIAIICALELKPMTLEDLANWVPLTRSEIFASLHELYQHNLISIRDDQLPEKIAPLQPATRPAAATSPWKVEHTATAQEMTLPKPRTFQEEIRATMRTA